ncbi:alpha/beta hydrolase [Janthinobacterium violaceinigrum]|uniref:Alpha/beta hydrolase n=1 Tax=Janthinobacterium violaceinigrum TaxID=2654252 RepID=A0A6I1I4B9_9BURK|nr:alpha/beta hydrolase [Janthinobacterium violaceinigrum]KAB8063326.1 alpha/beta hydrolase [Janthinobacterium violaceinigrum]
MAHGKSCRLHGIARGRSCLLSLLYLLLYLLCLPVWLTACTGPGGPADSAPLPVPAEGQTPPVPPAPDTPPANDAAPPAAQVPPPAPAPPGKPVRPPQTSPWTSSWSGLGGLFGNLGKRGGGAAVGKATAAVKAGGVAGATQVAVYYATDRKYEPDSNNYGWQPNRAAPYLSYGSVLVSIPEKRAPGEMPLPPWYALLSGDDAQKYVLIQGATRQSRADFLATVKARIQAAPERRAAFIYIHGYSNSFDDAARRTAQMAVDLDIGALPVFYSWPSKGTFAGYEFDENSAEWTQAHLEAFLADFAEHSSATDIYIIAHSMGNRPMTVALANLLEKRPDLLPLFKQVVLAAPDINADVFRDQIAPRFASLKLSATLYASANDKAIRASYSFADWDRIGDIRGPVVGIPGMELVDASAVIMNFMGHDYFASNRVLLTDIATLIKTGQRARNRGGLKGIPAQAPQYWAFP